MFPHPLMFLVHVSLCIFAEVHLDLLKAYSLELDICDYLTRHLDVRRVGYEEKTRRAVYFEGSLHKGEGIEKPNY